MKPTEFLNELSNDTLASYKKKAGADATAADKEGDTKKADKRFSGIVKATKKQFANDEKKEVAEGTQRVDSLVTDALKLMRGAEVSDAVNALKTVLGDREYNGRRGHYNFYVKQMLDMYGQQGVAEGEENKYGSQENWDSLRKDIRSQYPYKKGTTVTVPHKGKLVNGKIVRYEAGGGGYSPAYVVDIGEYESIMVEPNKVRRGVAEAGIPFRGVGGAFNRGDDERHDLDVKQPSEEWALKINGKVDSNNVFASRDQALKHRASLLSNTPELEIGLVTRSGVAEEKQRLDPSCWKGYKKQGTKMKGGVRVNNCVPVKESSIMQGVKQLDEGWKEKLGAAALAGSMALGATAAHSRVTYDADGNQVGGIKPTATVTAPSDNKPAAEAPKGFNKEYLQKAADPNRTGRYMISVEKAQELLKQGQGQ